MAAELRWETLFTVLAGASGLVYDNQAEFRNDSSVNVSIRKIRYAVIATIIGDDQDLVVVLTKSPTSTSIVTNNDTHFALPVRLAGDSTTGPAVASANGGDAYGKQQLTLEPGESLFINARTDAQGVSITSNFVIGYEF